MRTTLNTLLFATILLSSAQTKAAECGDYGNCREEFTGRSAEDCSDLNPEMADWFRKAQTYSFYAKDAAPIEKKLGPVRNQGNIGWCFAYAAAELMSYETGYIISAGQVAKNYFTNSKIAWMWGGKEAGLIDDALDLSYNKELCEEKSFPSRGLDIESAKKMNCTQPVVTITNLKTKVHTGNSTVFPQLDRILDTGKIAGVHYNANKLLFGEKANMKNQWANHASTIVSRYFDKGTNSCRYIIRNTWGKSCLTTAKSTAICKDGYYSVSDLELHQSMTQIIEVKEKH